MAMTVAEKILARAAGREAVAPGDQVDARPDFVLAYELRGFTDKFFRTLKELGIHQLVDAERFAIFIDHRVPSKLPSDEQLHVETRQWCQEHGVALYDRRGIGHQVAAEAGYAAPGALAVHFDGHISQLGTYGTLAFGLHSNLIEAFARERISMTVPRSILVQLSGTPRPGVMARDVFHHVLQVLGPSGCRSMVLELSGSSLDHFSDDALQTFTGLAMFTGALSAIIDPSRFTGDRHRPSPRATFAQVCSDPNANYAGRYHIDISKLQPLVALPPNPSNIHGLDTVLGLEVQAGYLGSCASGRLEDLRIAAQILSGRHVAPGFSLHIVPTSQAIMAAAASEGLLTHLIEAGAFVSSPSCDFCSGNIATMTSSQRAVSTGPLNVPGRMGASDSEIILCNPAIVAASAIEARIADPRKYLS